MLHKIKKLLRGNNAVVLVYHRVANTDIDPWDLSVSVSKFEEQLKLLKHSYNIVTVNELVRQLNRGRLHKNTVCITFDDGYQDNFFNAVPLLKQYECPATFFIATGFTDQQKLFWWDILTEIFLVTHKLPAELHFNELNFILENDGEITDEQVLKHKSWKWPGPPPTQRCAVYLSIWEHLKPLKNEELLKVINFLADWSRITLQPEPGDLPMSSSQLKQITSDKLFSLGAHTVNHPALGTQHAAVQENELKLSREFLYEHFENYTDTVAYPYGHYNEDTISIMRNENFEAGFTTEERTVNNKADIYRLGRFQVRNWTADELDEQLLVWKSQ